MSSSSALKYNIQNKPSVIAKVLTVSVLLLSAVFLFLLWGVGWFSGSVLFFYILASCYLAYSANIFSFKCSLSDLGHIEVQQPIQVIGNISVHSFYNRWIMFLCVEVADKFIPEEQKNNKPKKWFIVFGDSVEKKEFYLLARLLNSAR